MADVKPNYKIEIKKIQLQIKQQEANIDRCELDILEMADKVGRSLAGIEAAEKAIADYRHNLAGLEAEHGTVTNKDINEAVKAVEN